MLIELDRYTVAATLRQILEDYDNLEDCFIAYTKKDRTLAMNWCGGGEESMTRNSTIAALGLIRYIERNVSDYLMMHQDMEPDEEE